MLDYNGAIIAVSHDRYFLDRVAESLLVLGADAAGLRKTGSAEMVLATDASGVYSAYAQKIKEQKQAIEKEKIAAKRKTQGSATAPKAKTPQHLRPFNKYSPEQIEEMVLEMELEIDQMQHQFGDEKIYQNHELMRQLQADFEAKKKQLDLLYEAWEWRMQ